MQLYKQDLGVNNAFTRLSCQICSSCRSLDCVLSVYNLFLCGLGSKLHAVFHPTVLTVSLGLIDALFINYAYHSTLMKGASVQLVFGFEVSFDVDYTRDCCRNVGSLILL